MLILGGTAEARELAARLAVNGAGRVVTSLAGVTRAPADIAGEVRTGRFGGVGGLMQYLEDESIGLVADATHPFAARMSHQAARAAERAGIPYFRLERPQWTPGDGDNWRMVPDMPEAAAAIPAGITVLLTAGRQEVAPFFARGDVRIVARMIEPPDAVPTNVHVVLARPPFTVDEETALFREHGIAMLVTKNSGGETTRAKLDAARALKLPVIMVERPAKPDAPTAADANGLAALIATLP